MVICAQCGAQNPADARFCEACDAFLEWEGAPAKEQRPTTAQEQAATPRAAESGQPAVARPTVAQPGDERPRPRHPVVPETAERRPPAPGDLICGQCGEGNAPTRRFCRRCAASLAEAEVVEIPWWRRLLPKRGARAPVAGSRPGRGGVRRRTGRASAVVRRVLRIARNLIVVAVLLGGVLYGVLPPFRSLVNQQAGALRHGIEGIFVTRYAPVRPTSVRATTERPGHPATLVSDNLSNTYWAAPAGPAEPVLVLTFEQPVDIRKAIVRSGIGADFQSAHRPQKLHLVYSTGKTYDVNLEDTPEPREVVIGNSAGATSVELHVTALYRSLRGNDVAISEIELFAPG
jgi:ribosomal protein L40E